MTHDTNFDDEDIFSDEDISQSTDSKGGRDIPSWLTGDLISWLDRMYPGILMMRDISYAQMEQLIDEFERDIGYSYGFTTQQWLEVLEPR